MAGVSRGMNTMLYKTSWTSTTLSTGTTGTLASWTSPTITQSSEYSIMASLFTECRLLRCHMIFTPTQAVNSSVLQGAVIVSTNMLLNGNTGGNPSSYSDVQNQLNAVRFSTSSVRPLTYVMPVPQDLEYSGISSDAPNPATPWAGSPGAVLWYATGLTASTVYLQLHVECVYALRGRQ